MDSQQAAKVRELFDAASELPPLERAAFLNQHCADPAIRQRVEVLLASHDAAEKFLSTPAADLTALRTFASDSEPHTKGPDPLLNFTLGQYKITGVLGAGGMGIVYRAEQHATQRPVAVKVIRSTFADPGLLRRFSKESLVLGRLKHAGIAQIYEAGTAPGPDGRELPFFAMEFVSGRPLLEFGSTIGLREKLELFARICDAVNHAHQKGVIHRDLKPGNILIEEDSTGTTDTSGSTHSSTFGPQPKILDFGVARLTDLDAAAATMQTDVGQVIGTLAYMSPEQIRGESDRLDTRSDIYALGVILCELLTGQLPYSVRGKPLAQAARIIGEDDPTLNAATSRLIRGDVETIILKALAKEPERRYQSAAELSADIRRYLADLPIVARPATATYQVRKFASRNKALVGGIIATILVLTLGIVGTSIGMVKAREAQKLAIKREEKATLEARKATRAIGFLTSMLTASQPEDALGRDVTVRELLDTASRHVERDLKEEPEVLASVRDSIGRTYLSLGKPDSAEAHLLDAAQKRNELFGESSREYAASLESLATLQGARKKFTEQLELLKTNLDIHMKGASPEDPRVARASFLLGNTYLELGRYREALPHLRSAVSAFEKGGPSYRKELAQGLSSLAGTVLRTGDVTKDNEARELLDRSLAICRELFGNIHPSVADGLFSQGYFSLQVKDPVAAEARFRECLNIRNIILTPEHPKVLSARNSLGTALTQQQKFEEAETELNQVLALRQKSLGPNHADVGRTFEELATLAAKRGNVPRQEELLTKAVEILRQEGGIRFANAAHDLALLKSRIDKPAEAEILFYAALEIRRKLGQKSSNVAILLSDLGGFLTLQGRAAEGLPFLKEAAELLNELAPEGNNTATTSRRLAAAFAQLDMRSESIEAFERALKIAQSNKNPSALTNVVTTYAAALEKWGMPEKAKAIREVLSPVQPSSTK